MRFRIFIARMMNTDDADYDHNDADCRSGSQPACRSDHLTVDADYDQFSVPRLK